MTTGVHQNVAVWHLAIGLALIIAAQVLRSIVRNSVIRRRLRTASWVALAYLGLHVTVLVVPAVAAFDSRIRLAEQLLLMLALINGFVGLLNPWFREGVPDRLPSILQDTLIVAGLGLVASFILPNEKVLLTSTVAAAVVGFALQDTLGNAFAGLAIQIDRPFRVGHWISVGSFEGRVTEITWRATKLRTKAGNLIVVPNNIVSKEAISNYSEPEAPTRIFVEVGADSRVAPNVVRDAILAAMGRAPCVLKEPAADVMVSDFGASAIVYQARFWIADFATDGQARDQVRTAIYYEFKRREIEIPWPIQVQYTREAAPRRPAERRDRFTRAIAAVPVCAPLGAEAHGVLADAADERVFAHGEVIVREGDAGTSLFIVADGRVSVSIGSVAKAGPHEVATIEAGGYFGEMSLLTGAPRSATVTARGDCTLLEIGGDTFRAWVINHPEVLERVAEAATTRRRELDVAKAAATSAPAESPATLVQRMRKFFGLLASP
jgi:small-conductance mechanosensitive channel/CRP-like cAMP-binding protein